MNPENESLAGRQLGHISVIRELGRGGMGTVYEGYDNTLQRRVALKVIRREYRLEAGAKSRFLREARLLSQLDHPNICRVFDFVEEDDSDILVLELIQGRSLRQALRSGLERDRAMDVALQLLDVMALVHEQGVVHRDLKPENIMLTPEGAIKVLDFGLARSGADTVPTMKIAEAPEPADEAPEGPQTAVCVSRIETRHGAVIGTVGYMSPEQALGEPATASSDMYSVGLILQELFSGVRPYDRNLEPEELLERAMRGETEPVSGAPPELARLIERLKSYSPGARPSAADAAERLRWIAGTPARRRRRTLVAVVWVALLLLAGGMTLQWLRAERETVRAERETARAESEAAAAREVSDFLVGVFQVADPGTNLGETITAQEILDRGAARVERELAGEPDQLSRLLDVIGEVYSGLGLYERAGPLLERALELRLELYDEPHSLTIESRQHLGELCLRRGEFERTVDLLLPVSKWKRTDELVVSPALGVLARAYMELADFERAEAVLDDALVLSGDELGDAHPDTANLLQTYARLLQDTGRTDDAEAPRRKALAVLRKALPANDPRVATSLNNLGNYLRIKGEYEEAVEMLEEALSIREKTLGPDHPSVAITINNLALALKNIGEFERAEELYLRSIELRERTLGPDHPRIMTVYLNLASLYASTDEPEKLEAAARRALEISRRTRGPDHPYTAVALSTLAEGLRRQGRLDEAERAARQAVEIKTRAYGPNHRSVAATVVVLANILVDRGEPEQAEAEYRRGIEMYEKVLGPDHPSLAGALADLAVLVAEQGQLDEAELLLRRAQTIVEASRGPDYPSIAPILIELAKIHLRRGDTEKSRSCCERALKIASDSWGPEHPTVLEAEALYASISGEPAAAVDHGAG
jgi:tetratricopeptide (TPR) repeat protein